MSANASKRLKTIVGWNSSIAWRMGVRSSCTPMTSSSWPRLRSVVTTSHSIRHSGLTSAAGTISCGTSSLCTRTSTRYRFTTPPASQRHPMATAVQVVHRLHGQQHGELVAGLLFRDGEAQLELPAATDHVFEDLVDRVLVDAGPARDDAAY